MRAHLPLAALLLLVACATDEPAPAPPVAEPPPFTEDVAAEPIGEGELLPPEAGPDEGIRARRRMDLDELDASIQRVTGGIAWTELRDGEVVNVFELLGPTLGYPDYLDRTREDLSPSVLFQKFLGDAARDVCTQLAALEATSPEEPVLVVHAGLDDTWDEAPEAVEENLRYLLLRYHGTHLSPGDVALDPWTWLFRSTVQTSGSPLVAWSAVCVGLITHPDFYLY